MKNGFNEVIVITKGGRLSLSSIKQEKTILPISGSVVRRKKYLKEALT
jgi:hypothetical protein